MNKHQRWVVWGIIFVAITLLMLFLYTLLKPYVRMDAITQYAQWLSSLKNSHYVPLVIVYCIAYTALIAAGLPAATLCNIIAGFVFGVSAGSVYALVALTIGSCCSFMIVKRLVHRFASTSYHAYVQRLEHGITQWGIYFLSIIRLVPLIPCSAVTISAALLDVSLPVFACTTLVGCVPLVVLYVYAGQQLRLLGNLPHLYDLVSWPLVIGVGSAMLVGLLLYAGWRYWQRQPRL